MTRDHGDGGNTSCKEHLLSVSSSSYTNSNNNHLQVDIEECFQLAGSCGTFQKLLQLLFTYVVLTIGWLPFLPYFILDDPPWMCNIHNDTVMNSTSNDFCRQHVGARISPENENFVVRCSMNRSDWAYTTDRSYSIVTEFDLVCDRATYAACSTAVFFAGAIISASMSGKLADTYGRKSVLIALTTVTVVGSISCSYVSSLWQLLLARVIYGMGMPLYNVGIVYLMEFVPSDYRAISGLLYAGPYCFSVFLLDGIGYLEREWRKVQLYSALPILLAFIPIVMIPESPRWLLATGKSNKAERVMAKIAKCNGAKFWCNLQNPSAEDGAKNQTYSYIDLFRNKHVAAVTCAQALLWLTASMLYFTLGLESSKLGGNMYQVFALSTLFEVPGCFASLYLCNKFGRKKTILQSFILSALFTGAIAAIPRSFSVRHNILNIVFALLAKFFVNIAYCSMFVWSFELNPTVIRSQGMLLFNVLEQGGGMLAPFLVGVLQNVYYILPFIVMSVVTLVTSLLGMTLPETHGKPTREVYEDFFQKESEYEVLQGDVMEEKKSDGEKNGDYAKGGELVYSYEIS